MESVRVCLRHLASVLLLTLVVSSENVPSEMNILMRDAKPLTPDEYLCTAYPLEFDEAYIYKFEAVAEASTAHHMLLYGCDGVEYPHFHEKWGCPPMCKGGRQTIMFAWAKNAPATVLPKDVGLKIGKQSKIKTIVLQIHYAKAFSRDAEPDNSGLKLFLTNERPKYSAGILLMMSANFEVPANKANHMVDMSCQYVKPNTIYPFAYRTHAHSLGKVITGYVYNGSYHMIGKGNPQWPQAFYPTKDKVEVKKGDYLAARCTFDSSNRNRLTQVGATGNDEMCNFYIMYYTDSSVNDVAYECFYNEFPQFTGNHFPADVSVPLPHNAKLENEASGHHHHHGGMSQTQKVEVTTTPTTTTTTTTTTQKTTELVGNTNARRQQQVKTQTYTDMSSMGQNGKGNQKDSKAHGNQNTQENSNGFQYVQYPNYDYDNINPRDLSHKHGMHQEYYDDYAANDWRERSRFRGGDDDSDVGLSRNRNKEFDAMNKQLLQQQLSAKGQGQMRPRPAQPQQQQQQQSRQRQRGPGMDRRLGGGGQRNGRVQQGQGGVNDGIANDVPHSNIHIEKKLVYQPSWPEDLLNIGQVGGVSADKEGNVYIFHRASRIWDYSSFDFYDNFKYQGAPIDSDVVLVLDKNGKFIRKFGKGQFFMPHGVTVDLEGNIWLTDVAMHQVFKINKGESKINMTVGQRFKHSNDLNYFCKPADVAILSTGEFFVADGYCNSRIVKYSKDGKVLKAWGRKNIRLRSDPEPEVFEVVHNLAVSEKDNLICAADRENGRIQCFDLEGNFKHIIKHKEFGSKLFALDYSPLHGGVLYAVNGPNFDGPSNVAVQGFTMDIRNGALIDMWNLPQGLKNPHDMCVDPTGDSVYVGELDPRMVWKLTRMSDEEAKSVFVHFNLQDHDDDDDDDHHTETHVDSDVHPDLKEDKRTSPTPATANKTPSIDEKSGNNSSTLSTQNKMTAAETGLSASMIMGLVLTVPVVLLLVVVLVVRSYRSGNLKFLANGGKGGKRILNMQNIFGNSHKGFDPLSTEESDHELDPDDSDKEEYAAPRRPKT